MWPFKKCLDRNHRRKFARRVAKLEKLESRELFAADAFVGMYRDGTWTLDQASPSMVAFGLPGDQPVMGDWNGDGSKTPGIYRNGTWVLDLTGNGYDATDKVLAFGLPGDKAVAGDWNGDGTDTVGVFRSGQWYFDRDGNGYDSSDAIPVAFGLSTDSPVPGDWNGDGKDTPGIFRQGTWALDLTGNGYDNSDLFLQFGLPNDQPIAGDWDGDSRDTPAVLQNNNWYFDLEGNGYTGEVAQPNRLGSGIAVAGSARRVPEVDVDGIVDGQSNTVSFGTVAIGLVVEKDFTVRNLGSGTLTLGEVQVPSGFALVTGPTGRIGLPSRLAPLASATFRVRMNTTSGGSGIGTIQFTNNDANESPYNFVVSGTVLAPPQLPEVDVDGIVDGQSNAISFGSVAVGAVVEKDFTVRNLGSGTLTLGEVQVPSGFALVTGPTGRIGLPSSLAPLASATFRVRMNTTSGGSRIGTIQFTNNDANESPYNFVVSGTVLAPPQLPEVDVDGIVDGQSNAISFGTVATGTVVEKDFTVRNLGSGTLTLGVVQVPLGFSLVAGPTGRIGLPSNLAPLASATFRVRMNTTSVGSSIGTIQFTNNDANESPYNFVVSGTVASVSSNFGTVLSWQRIVGSTGVMVLKSVRTYGAEGNNIRLYGDFYSLSGSHIRSEVPIGDFILYGNQTMPQVAVIDNGRYAIAWRNTNITRTGGIHYAIVDAFGATIGSRDQTANITFSPNLELTSIVPAAYGGFRISWRDSITKIAWRRDFTSVGSATSGEVRI